MARALRSPPIARGSELAASMSLLEALACRYVLNRPREGCFGSSRSSRSIGGGLEEREGELSSGGSESTSIASAAASAVQGLKSELWERI